jgi:NitT/TauT family transport system substrate-binding protein
MSKALVPVLFLSGVCAAFATDATLRVGYFPNITHAQGLIGSETTREGRGWFEKRLGPGIRVQWYPFNAGPSAMEAIFADSIDLTYVGPSPALNAYIRSDGDEIRILAGAAEGGAALVVHAGGHLARPGDFKGARVATPQLGNTQDVAARAWLRRQGFDVTMTGGDVLVVPVANADQLSLFQQDRVDAVWTVEPWVTRLEQEAGGRVFLEQKDAITTILVASAQFLRAHTDLADRFRSAHSELTAWMNANPTQARELVGAGLAADLHHAVAPGLISAAWGRLAFTDRIEPARFAALVADAQAVGFLRNAIPLDRLFSRKP